MRLAVNRCLILTILIYTIFQRNHNTDARTSHIYATVLCLMKQLKNCLPPKQLQDTFCVSKDVSWETFTKHTEHAERDISNYGLCRSNYNPCRPRTAGCRFLDPDTGNRGVPRTPPIFTDSIYCRKMIG